MNCTFTVHKITQDIYDSMDFESTYGLHQYEADSLSQREDGIVLTCNSIASLIVPGVHIDVDGDGSFLSIRVIFNGNDAKRAIVMVFDESFESHFDVESNTPRALIEAGRFLSELSCDSLETCLMREILFAQVASVLFDNITHDSLLGQRLVQALFDRDSNR